ncbi:unnamed protein product [Lasius platythorax]|uniref:Secreted protein n=1 Tax=Lasius platythorax TaxID=488582 RepID=A0AAV2N8X5_9HYME
MFMCAIFPFLCDTIRVLRDIPEHVGIRLRRNGQIWGKKKVGRSGRNRTRYVLTGEALCVTSQSKLLGDFTGFAWHSHIFRRASTFITSCLMTSFPETFVLNSRDIRSGDGETHGEALLFVFVLLPSPCSVLGTGNTSRDTV